MAQTTPPNAQGLEFKPINPAGDDRVSHEYAVLNGRQYHYLLGLPKGGDFKKTIFLVHGWPDLSMGWRYQIPLFLDLGFRVVAMDIMGYGGTDAPHAPPEPLRTYSLKQAADDVAALAEQLGAKRIVLGGHDWGGMIVYRTCLWHPELVSHVFSICTPYQAPSAQYISLEDIVAGPLPQFGYQLHLAGPEVEASITTEADIRGFINGIFGGRTPDGDVIFDAYKGIDFEKLRRVGKSPIMSDAEIDYYVKEYARHGLHGALNWYRTRKVNWEDELQLKKSTIDIPCLFVLANRDTVLKPNMSKGMEKYLTSLTRKEVEATHWALWQKPAVCNAHIREWLERTYEPKSSL